MSWWPFWQYPGYPPPIPPLTPEEELAQLEAYKRELEREIKEIEEELKRVDQEIEKLKKELEEGGGREQPQPMMPQPFMPPYGFGYGYGYGYGWGRRRGMGGGFGGRMGAGMPPTPAAMPQQPPIPPPQSGVKRVVASVEENNGLNSRISSRFGRCPFLAFVDIADGEVKSVNIVPNQAASMPMGAGMAVAQLVISSGASEVIGSNFGPNVSAAFQQAGLKVHVVEPLLPLGEALKKLGLIR